MFGILSNLFTSIDLKTLIIVVALIIGVPCLALKIHRARQHLPFSQKSKRRLDFAMGVPGLCLLGISLLDMLNGAPMSVYLLALFLVGFILMTAAAGYTFLEFGIHLFG